MQHEFVQVNVNFEPLRDELADLEDVDYDAVRASFVKISQMTWQQVYNTSTKGPGKRGLNYEPLNQFTKSGKRIATTRITQKFRARVVRDGRIMKFISLHPDHDSAYDELGVEDL